ncbi:hypothetical protein FNF29_07151 [Cafeteria roenbergensis]|uniref:TRP C-terminal domain-containing protein n=2 Tax=Cafeteria roenbergensis TaxID=33653 RepID=A0A5A8C4L1_CAFRO|nr:hypothetical protein FNF29_07151 [Cafeteria roenbergensis]|eukprot:KAA0147808.1 hypothetical protein FNF29_07151 [Cafeteria roenbergensis]
MPCSTATDCLSGNCAFGMCAAAAPGQDAAGCSGSGSLTVDAGDQSQQPGLGFLVDETAVVQPGVPYASSMTPSSGPSGPTSSVRFYGGAFDVSPTAIFRTVVASPATRARLPGSASGTCMPAGDSFVECGVPSHSRATVVLAVEYSASGSVDGPWLRVQPFYFSTGRYRITGRAGAVTGLRITSSPASLVQGSPLLPAPAVSLVDDFGAVVTTDSSTIVRVSVFSTFLEQQVSGLQATAGSDGSATPQASRAHDGVATFEGLSVAAGSQIIGHGLRLVFEAHGCAGAGAIGAATDLMRGFAKLPDASQDESVAECEVLDSGGRCCEAPAALDACGICSTATGVSEATCGIRIDVPVVVAQAAGAGAPASSAQLLPAEIARRMQVAVGNVAGFPTAATGSASVSEAGTIGGVPLAAASNGGTAAVSAEQPRGAGEQLVVSVLVPPPAGGWPSAGPNSREEVEQRLLGATTDPGSALFDQSAASSDPALGDSSLSVLPDASQAAPVLSGGVVCSGACSAMDIAAGCMLCADDPAGLTSNATLAATHCAAAGGQGEVAPDGPTDPEGGGGGGVPEGNDDPAASLPLAQFGAVSPSDKALANIHAAVVATTAVVALAQGAVDAVRAARAMGPLHSGPGSGVAAALPGLAAVGMGLWDVADHGQFTTMLSLLHVASPPVVAHTGQMVVSASGLVPGAWSILEPVLGPMVGPAPAEPPLQGASPNATSTPTQSQASWQRFPDDPAATGDASAPASVRILSSFVGARPEELLALALALFVLAELLVAVVFGVALVIACRAPALAPVPAPAPASTRTHNPMRKAARGPGGAPASTSSGPVAVSAVAAVGNRMSSAMLLVATIFLGAVTVAALFGISAPSSSAAAATGGWLVLAVFSGGLAALCCAVILRAKPCACTASLCASCRGGVGEPGQGPDVHAYQGKGARLVDGTRRFDHARAGALWWLVIVMVADRIASALLLVLLSSRPGAQTGAMLAKQVLLLAAVLSLRPGANPAAQLVTIIITAWRVLVLALMLAFVPPYSSTNVATLRAVGEVVVVLQIICAFGLLALVLLRFGPVARFAAAATAPCCAASSRRSMRKSIAGPDAASGNSKQSLVSAAGSAASPQPAEMLTALPMAATTNPMQRHGTTVSTRRADPHEATPHGKGPAERKAFAPTEGAKAPGETGLSVFVGHGARQDGKLLNKGSSDAAGRAGAGRLRPLDNPMLKPRRLAKSPHREEA